MILVYLGRWSYGRFKDDNNIFYKMKNDLTTGTWQDDIWCPIFIILLCTSDKSTHILQCWTCQFLPLFKLNYSKTKATRPSCSLSRFASIALVSLSSPARPSCLEATPASLLTSQSTSFPCELFGYLRGIFPQQWSLGCESIPLPLEVPASAAHTLPSASWALMPTSHLDWRCHRLLLCCCL